MASTITSSTSLLMISTLLVASDCFTAIEAQTRPPIVDGLSWTFYQSTCPNLESIIRNELRNVFNQDVGQAAGLLRLHFHDCFVQGCDGSILIDGSNERSEIPNLTLRNESFKIVENLREIVHRECGRVVSCSDILTIAARDSVFLTGGPDYQVPLGRRDGVTLAPVNQTFVDLVAPSANTSTILSQFARKNLDTRDAVVLSGAHTIGISHCTSFTDRLFPNQDPTMNTSLANSLRQTCPTPDSDNTVVMDVRTPNRFDHKYYVGLLRSEGLFTSDQDLFTDTRTRLMVTVYAISERGFFLQFPLSMIKMGQLDVLTGTQGEIRADCSVRNSDNKFLVSAAEENLSSSFEMK